MNPSPPKMNSFECEYMRMMGDFLKSFETKQEALITEMRNLSASQQQSDKDYKTLADHILKLFSFWETAHSTLKCMQGEMAQLKSEVEQLQSSQSAMPATAEQRLQKLERQVNNMERTVSAWPVSMLQQLRNSSEKLETLTRRLENS